MSRITISGNDLFHMDLGHLHHSVAGEFVIRKKLDPVAVLDLGLGQALRAALKVVGIGDRQLSNFYYWAVGIRVCYCFLYYSSLIITAPANGIYALAIKLAVATRPLGLFQSQLGLRLAATCCERKGYSQNYNENLYCFHATRPKPSADGLSPLSTFWAGVLYYKCEHGSNC